MSYSLFSPSPVNKLLLASVTMLCNRAAGCLSLVSVVLYLV